MTEAAVVSKKIVCKFGVPVKAKVVEEEIGRILLDLGQKMNYKGKIIGHLKAIAVSSENYLQMSLTSLPDLTVKTNSLWSEQDYTELDLTVNIIVFGYTKDDLEHFLQECIKRSKIIKWPLAE